MAIPAKADPGSMLEAVMLEGDLSKMPPEQRVKYYNEVCTSLGLNPLTRPFQYIVLNGKLQLYALRACTDQLRKIHGISLEIVSREVSEDILTVHVRAKAADGRIDEDIGVVPFPGNIRGDARANTEMKAVTKAKRRATLSLCGLGWLDESEIETIKDAKPVAGPDAMAGAGPVTGPVGGNGVVDHDELMSLKTKCHWLRTDNLSRIQAGLASRKSKTSKPRPARRQNKARRQWPRSGAA